MGVGEPVAGDLEVFEVGAVLERSEVGGLKSGGFEEEAAEVGELLKRFKAEVGAFCFVEGDVGEGVERGDVMEVLVGGVGVFEDEDA